MSVGRPVGLRGSGTRGLRGAAGSGEGTSRDKDVAEITGIMTRSGNWPGGLRWIVRRVKPSCRHMKNLTAYEETGWKYSIICTNVPDEGIEGAPAAGTPGSSTCCTASTPSSRTASARARPPGCGTSLKGFARNQVWCEIVALACGLLAWTRMLAPTGTARRWELRRLRLCPFSAAGRLACGGRRLRPRLAERWPWAADITAAVTLQQVRYSHKVGQRENPWDRAITRKNVYLLQLVGVS
jgi:hypothetical protein